MAGYGRVGLGTVESLCVVQNGDHPIYGGLRVTSKRTLLSAAVLSAWYGPCLLGVAGYDRASKLCFPSHGSCCPFPCRGFTTLHPAPCTLHPAPCSPHPAPCTLLPAPCPCPSSLTLCRQTPTPPGGRRCCPRPDTHAVVDGVRGSQQVLQLLQRGVGARHALQEVTYDLHGNGGRRCDPGLETMETCWNTYKSGFRADHVTDHHQLQTGSCEVWWRSLPDKRPLTHDLRLTLANLGKVRASASRPSFLQLEPTALSLSPSP